MELTHCKAIAAKLNERHRATLDTLASLPSPERWTITGPDDDRPPHDNPSMLYVLADGVIHRLKSTPEDYVAQTADTPDPPPGHSRCEYSQIAITARASVDVALTRTERGSGSEVSEEWTWTFHVDDELHDDLHIRSGRARSGDPGEPAAFARALVAAIAAAGRSAAGKAAR